MPEPFADYLKRPLRYNMVDGIGEMGLGVLLIGLSIFNILLPNPDRISVWHSRIMPLGFMAVLLVVVLWAEGAAKNRITYRRTGYVKYRHSRLTAVSAGLVTALIAAAAAYILTKFWHAESGSGVLLAGLSMCALYAYWTRMNQPWRWIMAVVMIVAPVAVRLFLVSDPDDWRSTDFIIGMCWLVDGAITFCLYLRNTRPAENPQ